LTDSLAITPIHSFRATLRPPGSKSLTNRALLLAAIAEGESIIREPLHADDTERMIDALRSLGLPPIAIDDHELKLQGQAGRIPACHTHLDLGNAGTAMRSLIAACCLGKGTYRLDGNHRMRNRPVGELVDALRQIGARIVYDDKEGYPPLTISCSGLTGGQINMTTTVSSQFISALLMIGPYCHNGLTLQLQGPITSRPYVQMTIRMMGLFGAKVEVDPQWRSISVENGSYRGQTYTVEPDASSATYFMAAAAIIPGSQCTITGLGKGSLQGDIAFADLLFEMGAGLLYGVDFITIMAPTESQCLHGIDVDLNHMPDAALTLAAIAPFCQGPTAIRNIGNLRIKETDRLSALKTELTKLGAIVQIDGDDLFIEPPSDGRVKPTTIDTYDDHRIAMSFTVTGLRAEGIVINDPDCVNKTFPEFFEYLKRLDNQT